jgi:hypothetical protein
MVCGTCFRAITPTHLRKHGFTVRRYVEKFPNANLCSGETKEKRSVAASGEGNSMYGVHLCGEEAPHYGIYHTEKSKRRMAAAKIGERNPMYGRHHTDKSRKQTSISMKTSPAAIKQRKGLIHKNMMTDIEKALSYLLRHIAPGEFRYNGNGRLHLNFDGIFPDFVNVNGRKQVVEVFSHYWKELSYGSVKAYKISRRSRYKKIGYDVLFVEKNELKDRSELSNKVADFVGDTAR